VKEVNQLADPERWRLLREPPLADAAILRQTLLDPVRGRRCAGGGGDSGNRSSTAALDPAGKRGWPPQPASLAAARMQRVADALVRAVGDAGHRAQVVRREGPVEAHRSPSDDFLVLIDVDSIYAWEREITTIGDVCRPLLENRGSFIMAPVHLGNIVGSFGVKVITDIYPDQSVRDWPDLPLPLLHDPESSPLSPATRRWR